MLGKNKIEIQEIMGIPEGKSLDGGNGYFGITEDQCMMRQQKKSMSGV